MRRTFVLPPLLLVLVLLPVSSRGDFEPDAYSVQRYGPAYRYPQAGWIVLHIEGEPYERGCQHGRLMAEEIAAYVRCFAAVHNHKAPADGWKNMRTLVNALFLRRYHKEYLEEMKGIADGASAAGARFDGRPLDLVDIVALNSWSDIETLPRALHATATGLESVRFPHDTAQAKPEPKPMHCSAFAANGKATRDGKIVFGHITMSGLYPSNYYNVWLDVKPTHGHRVLMQTYPGGIQSGLDYYLNDAGLIVCETTLAQTRFAIDGLSVASRIRKALQYADTIDGAVAILKELNNGLYTNEWLLADIKSNEIAMFELGTNHNKLYRSGNNEWYGGTEGFYWGCNNTKDLQVRLETIAAVEGRPAVAVFRPSPRDKKWLALYDQYKGTIDEAFAKRAFTTPPLAAYHSADAKFTTSELARDLKTWALFGPPLGRTWKPTYAERQRYPEVRPLVGNPWTMLHAKAPKSNESKIIAVDLPNSNEGGKIATAKHITSTPPPTIAAWHGTLLPKSDADIWLATGFANYERIATLDNALKKRATDGKPSESDRRLLARTLFARRTEYEIGARAGKETTLTATHADLRNNDWYRVAIGKGVWLLHSLRRQMGDKNFDAMMDAFGRTHAGKAVSAAQFQAHVEKWLGNSRKDFFDVWLTRTGLPHYRIVSVSPTTTPKGYETTVEIGRDWNGPQTAVDVTIETAGGEETRTVHMEGKTARIVIETHTTPLRAIVDKYGQTARSNGGPFSILTFHEELERTLIVYGMSGEENVNREAAEALQQAIRAHWSNITVPILGDTIYGGISPEKIASHHILLIGRPDTNAVVKRFRDALPITFGSGSFTVGKDIYAHPNSGVIAAAENPLNKRYSMVVVAGLDAASTLHTAPRLAERKMPSAEVLIFPHGGAARPLVLPAKDLVCEIRTAVSQKAN